MTIINFIGGLVNSNIGHFSGNLSDFPDTIVCVAIFCGLYLLTVVPKIILAESYRLPIIRTLFWTLFVTLDILYPRKGVLETADYGLALVNSGLCMFYDTILFKVYNGGTDGTYLEIYGLGIFLFAIYEFIIIKTSTILADKFSRRKIMVNVT